MHTYKKIVLGTVLLICILFIGCTKEKAEAVKLFSEQFRDEATKSLNQIKSIVYMNIEMPPIGIEKIAQDLNDDTNLTIQSISFLIEESKPDTSKIETINKELDGLEKIYNEFASIFESLPQGHMLAASAVKKAQKFSIELTLNMINFAEELHSGKIRVTNNTKRILLLEQINQDKAIKDTLFRKEKLLTDAKLIKELGQQEIDIKNQAIIQCLKAAAVGKQCSNTIRDYSKLNMDEILSLTRQTLEFGTQISSQNSDVVSLLNKFKAIETSIRNDEYWKQIINTTIIE